MNGGNLLLGGFSARYRQVLDLLVIIQDSPSGLQAKSFHDGAK